METIIGSSWPVFWVLTVVLFGGAAWMTGQAVAGGWKPIWQLAGYALLLAAGNRFLVFALFDGELLAVLPLVTAFVALVAIAFAAHRVTRAGQMAGQYPWLYERSGLFSWRERRDAPKNA